MRALAQRSAAAAREIKGLISTGAEQTAAEQTRGVTEVSTAVAQLDQDTQRNAALVEQTTAAAVSMNQMASELAAAADRFTLPVG